MNERSSAGLQCKRGSPVTCNLSSSTQYCQHKKNTRDAQLRGRSTPVFPVRLRRWRARLVLRGVFVAAQKFVSFNLGYNTDAAGFIDFGTLDASETPHLHRACECNLMRQRQQNFHWRNQSRAAHRKAGDGIHPFCGCFETIQLDRG